MDLPLVVIDGTKVIHSRLTRYRAEIAGCELLLRGVPFRTLTLLALARLRTHDLRWLDREVLTYPPMRAKEHIYQLRQAIIQGLYPRRLLIGWDPAIWDGDKSYCLNTQRRKVKVVNPQALRAFRDEVIGEMLDEANDRGYFNHEQGDQ